MTWPPCPPPSPPYHWAQWARPHRAAPSPPPPRSPLSWHQVQKPPKLVRRRVSLPATTRAQGLKQGADHLLPSSHSGLWDLEGFGRFEEVKGTKSLPSYTALRWQKRPTCFLSRPDQNHRKIKMECCPVFAVQLLLGATQISLRLRNTLLDALASLDLKLSVGQRQGSPFLKCVVSI